MRKILTVNYRRKIITLLSDVQYKQAEKTLKKSSNDELEAFWHIIVAGYPVCFAVKHSKTLCHYLQDHPHTYAEALTTYRIYPGFDNGILITKTQWFELN
jgi:hypothetical protein